MRILVLGCGMQGKAVIHDVCTCDEVEEVVAVDAIMPDPGSGELAKDLSRITFLALDVSEREKLVGVMKGGFDVVINMLPTRFSRLVAEAAIETEIHLVSANYDTDLRDLHKSAVDRHVVLMPECGMDPGIDLVLCGEAVKRFDEVHELRSYGGGIPEASTATNPLKYKITWTFEGVLRSYTRDARILSDQKVVEIPARHIFDEEVIHSVDIPGVGELEAFPNGDAVGFAEKLGIRETVRSMGRYTLRWPGHSRLWKVWVDLGFLHDRPVPWLRERVTPRQFLRRLLEPQLQLSADEGDLAILRVDASGVVRGRDQRLIQHVIDRRDMETGFTAMNRTVGYTASIVAQMIGMGNIRKRGLLSPARDVPYDPFVAELGKRGITISSAWTNDG